MPTLHSAALLFFCFAMSACTSISTGECYWSCKAFVSESRGNSGEIAVAHLFGDITDAYAVARLYCKERGSDSSTVDIQSKSRKGSDYYAYRFECGTSPATPATIQALRLSAEGEAAKQKVAQQELEEKLRQSRQQPVAPVQAVTAPSADRLSLDASKVKCTDLGFKPGTEAHGKCVLQLSK